MKNIGYGLYINNTSKQFDERGFECMLAVVLVLFTLFLLFLFPVMGVALSIFASCFLCVGFKYYLLGIAKDQAVMIESIYAKWRICIKAFCLKVAQVLIFLLWSLMLIIPGIVVALNYSMASFVMAEDDKISSLEAMIKSKNLVYGYRAQIFIIYLCYALASLMALMFFSALVFAMMQIVSMPVWLPIVSMLVAYLFVLIIFIIPYFELGLANVYLAIKDVKEVENKPKKTTRKRATKAQTAIGNQQR